MITDTQLGNILVSDVRKHLADVLDANQLEATISSLQDISEATLKVSKHYGANGSLSSLFAYVKAQCNISGGKTFDGSAWGGSFPGASALFGDVYLSGSYSLDDLYSKTTNFAFTAVSAYTAFYFYDKHGHLLGHFQAGGIVMTQGAGKGSGSWS